MRCTFEQVAPGEHICTVCNRPWWKLDPVLPLHRNCGQAGIGDGVERALKRLGLKSCGGCKRRREALNDAGRAITRLVKGYAETA